MSTTGDGERELEGDDALAAEYVLGVLGDEDRARTAARIEAEPAFARLVDSWEERLSPMARSYSPVEPPASVKQALDRRLFAGAASTVPAKTGIWSSLAFWRGMALAGFASLALLIALPLATTPTTPPERLVASLAPRESDVHYFVVYDGRTQDIGLSHVTGERADDRDFELWVIEDGQPPMSLGVIPTGSSTHLAVSREVGARIASGAVFAISLEPKGGSPSGAPTGPVVAAGDLRSI